MSQYQQETPSLDAAGRSMTNDAIRRLRTALPGRVVSFDPERQTAVIEAMTHQVLQDGASAAIPPLLDVPVQFPRAGGFVITFPVKAGDEGQIIINDRCIDGWWQSGAGGAPLAHRLHDLSDATFIPGITSLPHVVRDFATDAVVLRNLDGDAYVRLGEDRRIEIDGELLTVKCPAVFEKVVTYQDGIDGTGGSNGNRLRGGMALEGGQVTHDGKNIGSTHGHTGVAAGGDTSGGPA